MSDIILKDQTGNDVTYENVNAVLLNTVDGGTATYVSGDVIPTQVQPDWNQIDNTQFDYIKNKPFYEERAIVDIVPITTYDNFTFNSTFGAYCVTVEVDYTLTIGQTYIVSWDGTEYECVAQDASALIYGAVALGNCTNFGLSGNNEPFIIGIVDGYAMYFSTTDTAVGGSHDVGIVHDGIIIHQIDKKYISIPYFGSSTETKELISSTDLIFTFGESEGAYTYECVPSTEQVRMWQDDWMSLIVTWDGTEYACEPQYLEGIKCVGNLDIMMGAGDNGMPFLMMMADASLMGQDICMIYSIVDVPGDVNPDVTHNISILMNTEDITPIDQKYITNVSWDKITDKPFEVIPTGTSVFEQNVIMGATTNGITIVGMGESSALRSRYIIDGATYSVMIGGTTYNGVGSYDSSDNARSIVVIDDSRNEVAHIVNGYHGYDCVLNNTTYFPNGNSYDIKVTLAEDAIIKLDSKYLPDDIGGGSSIPKVTTDDNDKVLTVVNGVWTAQTPASGLPEVTVSDTGKFLRVSSSGAWAVEAIPNAEEASF